MHTYDLQILKLIEILKGLGEINFDTDFCTAISISKQHLNNIKRQQKQPETPGQNYHFTAAQIQTICDVFGTDANWIYGFTEKPFRPKLTKSKQKV